MRKKFDEKKFGKNFSKNKQKKFKEKTFTLKNEKNFEFFLHPNEKEKKGLEKKSSKNQKKENSEKK